MRDPYYLQIPTIIAVSDVTTSDVFAASCTHSTCTAKEEQNLEGHASETVFKMKKDWGRKREVDQEGRKEGGRKEGGKEKRRKENLKYDNDIMSLSDLNIST